MQKGFTLIELLVVVAILVVLSVAVVLVLNPAEIVKQGRDATRISDLSAINSAIALFVADVNSPVIGADWVASSTCTVASTSPFFAGGNCSALPGGVTTSTAINGTGWVSVALNKISSGSPLSRLPIDPVNSATGACLPGSSGCFYAFKAGSLGVYEVDARMESIKYNPGGSADVVTKDGGNNGGWYETGTDLVQ